MKNVTSIFTAAAFTLATFGNQVYATSANILTESDWQAISDSAEIESIDELEEIPTINTVFVSTLEVELSSGKKTNMLLKAPFKDEQIVGLAIFDEKGTLVHSATGSYADLKNLSFADYFNWDMTYVVRMYAEDAIFETKLAVAYR